MVVAGVCRTVRAFFTQRIAGACRWQRGRLVAGTAGASHRRAVLKYFPAVRPRGEIPHESKELENAAFTTAVYRLVTKTAE